MTAALNNYIKLIKEKNLNLIIESCSLNSEGQNNDVVIVNDCLVFKFPKYSEGIGKLKREVELLNILNKHIALSIPSYEHVNFTPLEPGSVYGGYKMIRGTAFRKNFFQAVSNKEYISRQLAGFLKELHSISLDELEGKPIKVVDNHKALEDLYERIKNKLFDYMRKDAQETVAKNFSTFLEKNLSTENVLIHGDFGPSNIMFDEEKQCISGVIDFNDLCFGDPAVDIASLIGPFGYGEEFIRSFESVYPNVEQLLNRARFYASTFALQEALFGVENNDKAAFEAGISEYL